MTDVKEFLSETFIPALEEMSTIAINLTEEKTSLDKELSHKVSLMKALAEIWKDYKDNPDVVINDIFEDEVKEEDETEFGFTKKNSDKDSDKDSDTEYETDEESEFEDEPLDAETDEMSKEEKEFYKQEANKVLEMKLRSLRLAGSLAKNKGFGFIIEISPTEKDETLFKEGDGIVDDNKLDEKYKVVKKKINIRKHNYYGSYIGFNSYNTVGKRRGKNNTRNSVKSYWNQCGTNPYIGSV